MIEAKAQIHFGESWDTLFADDAYAWFAVCALWLAEGIGLTTFVSLARYDERVRWGSEAVPDAETWGMDAGTQAAMALMEAQWGATPQAEVTEGDALAP